MYTTKLIILIIISTAIHTKHAYLCYNCIFRFGYITHLILLFRIRQMKTISVSVSATNSLLIEKSERHTNDAIRTKITKSPNDVSMHKNLLSCNLCSWSVSYTDYSCSLDTIHEYATVTCPVCKDGRIKSSVMIS
jgi:hypothetical protein